MPSTIDLREEGPEDIASIFRLNAAAFPTAAEARLVDALRANRGLTLSLVAIRGGEVIGHIAFSPVTIESAAGSLRHGIGLAPMAVAAEARRQGVGGLLISEGLRRLRTAGHLLCVVLGHASYYPRHGFVRASELGLRWERSGHADSFFVQAFGDEAPAPGVVRYRPEFESV